MKYSPYSFSRLNTHEQCNRRFKYQYIDKIPQGPFDMTALLKGSALHNILEHYPEPSTHKLASKYQYLADTFINSPLGNKYLSVKSTREFRFGLNKDLSPCNYSDKTAMFRGAVDFITILDNTVHLCDWKSGRAKELKYQDFSQLLFYGIYFFQKYQNINKIKISYIYIEHNEENELMLERQYLTNYTNSLLNMINSTELDTKFNKNITRLCDWCPFQKHCSTD